MSFEKWYNSATPIVLTEDMVRAIEFGRKKTARVPALPAGIPKYVRGNIVKVRDDMALEVIDIHFQRVEEITEDETIDEGYSSRAEFLGAFFEIYPEADLQSWVWVYEFERIEVDSV